MIRGLARIAAAGLIIAGPIYSVVALAAATGATDGWQTVIGLCFGIGWIAAVPKLKRLF